MKKRLLYLFLAGLALASCQEDWDKHYNEAPTIVETGDIEVTQLTCAEFIDEQTDLTAYDQMLDRQGITDSIAAKEQKFTYLVYTDELMDASNYTDEAYFANTCISNVLVTPTKIDDGMSIQMWNGKYLSITLLPELEDTSSVSLEKESSSNEIYFAGSRVQKIVAAENGYIYYLNSPVYAPKSMYEQLLQLDDDLYSTFKEMVLSYEIREFDRGNSTPIGVDETGNTVYDSVFVTKNTFMDRYDRNGNKTWDMRSEYYNSTMFALSNTLIQNAKANAYDYIIRGLARTPTTKDTLKVNEWIVKSAFYDKVLTPADLSGDADVYSVAGYQEGASVSTDGAQWRPSVQTVDLNGVELSNGVMYYVTNYKLPNNYVLFRLKGFHFNWRVLTADQQAEFYQFENMNPVNPPIIRTYYSPGIGPYGDEFPAYDYATLRFYPDPALNESGQAAKITFKGYLVNESGVAEAVMLPPGEYTLFTGANKATSYGMNMYFNGTQVATGFKNSGLYDRQGGGTAEGFISSDWGDNGRYDRDGNEVGIVVQDGDEPSEFTITIESFDALANSSWMELFHWALRPTENNY